MVFQRSVYPVVYRLTMVVAHWNNGTADNDMLHTRDLSVRVVHGISDGLVLSSKASFAQMPSRFRLLNGK